jgi:hypothetical protein
METQEKEIIIHKGRCFVYLDHSAGSTYSIFGNENDRILVDTLAGSVFHEYQSKKPEITAAPTQ